jgi:hypothetical protein
MSKMAIYEPAMCCPTGLCGVGIDPELMRIAAVVDGLKKKGVVVGRYNLSSAPQAFVRNAEIYKRLMEGVDFLPATVVDGRIVVSGRYPTNQEIAQFLGVPAEDLESGASEADAGCCCGGDGCCG